MKKRRRNIRLFVMCFALMGLLATSCGGREDDTSSSTEKGSMSDDTSSSGGTEEATGVVDTSLCDAYDGSVGVSGDTIKVGTSLPQSGLFSVFKGVLQGEQAYFDMVNAAGGVELDGKKYQLELVAYDDEYDPAKTATNTDKLINNDKVFAIMGQVGTNNVMQVRDTLNAACVPTVPALTGSPMIGDPTNYPWVISGLPSYATEAQLFADYLKENMPEAKVAILKQGDDVGDGYVDAFKAALDGTDISVAAEEEFDPRQSSDVKSQITSLAASDADVLYMAMTGSVYASAFESLSSTGWKPTTYMSLTSVDTPVALAEVKVPGSVDGVLSSRFTYSPTSTSDAAEPAVVKFLEDVQANGISKEEITSEVAAGWTSAQFFVTALEQAGTPDRAALMDAAYNLNGVTSDLLLTDVKITTSPNDPWGIESLQLMKREGGAWVPEGDLQSYETE